MNKKIGFKFIQNEEHYKEVLKRVEKVKFDLAIGTADVKDLYVENKSGVKPFLAVLNDLLKRGVSVRLIHAKEPGPRFREDFDKYSILAEELQRRLCPRVHFKILIFDSCMAYVGSANLTGAAIGMKSNNNRNFEAGILSDDIGFVDEAAQLFNSVWEGIPCKNCGRKAFCSDRIKSD